MSGVTGGSSLQAEVWRVAAQLEKLPDSPERGFRLDELTECFRNLRDGPRSMEGANEGKIWSIWCDHPEPGMKAQMISGIRWLNSGDLARAEDTFDRMIEERPDWAEAWNKRATVYFLQGRDTESVSDISRTLELEPRHFGALGGFAQICMRSGAPDVACAALERLLLLNPRAQGVGEALAAIRRSEPKTLH